MRTDLQAPRDPEKGVLGKPSYARAAKEKRRGAPDNHKERWRAGDSLLLLLGCEAGRVCKSAGPGSNAASACENCVWVLFRSCVLHGMTWTCSYAARVAGG